MKTYKITNAYKKSVIEINYWKKPVEGGNIFAEYEIGWRSGTFLIDVPETDEEIKQYLEDRGLDQEDLEFIDFLPDADDDHIELEDYDAEMVETWDGCWDEWRVRCYPEGIVSEEELDEIRESIEEIFSEDHECGLEDEGWEMLDCSFFITDGAIIEEYNEGT